MRSEEAIKTCHYAENVTRLPKQRQIYTKIQNSNKLREKISGPLKP